jgi:uncharacterized protein (TIGR00297 family)
MLGEVIAGFSIAALFAALAYALGMVSRGGTLGGFLVGVVVYLSLGPEGFAVLALFVVGGSALTRLGYRDKQQRGVAQGHQGRRGARNALANCGVAVLCALFAALISSDAFVAAFVASLGAAFADTAESEVGQLARRTPRLITNLQKVPPGTDGAISLPGTLAGLAVATLTAFFGVFLGLVSELGTAFLVAGAAFSGTVADSFVGALTPRVGNELTNVICTLVAAALVLVLV